MLQRCQLDLWSACEHGDAPSVRRCLEAGAKVGVKNRLGWNALHRACMSGSTECVDLLLPPDEEEKAHSELLRQPDGAGNTPLHIAAGGGHIQVTESLLRAGASADVSGKGSQDGSDDPGTPMHVVCKALSAAVEPERQSRLQEVVRICQRRLHTLASERELLHVHAPRTLMVTQAWRARLHM